MTHRVLTVLFSVLLAAAPGRAAAAPGAVVLAPLDEASLASLLESLGWADRATPRPCPEAEVAAALAEGGPALAIGYPVATLAPVVARGGARFWGEDGAPRPLFADPVVVVWSDGGLGVAEAPSDLPRTVAAFAGAESQERLWLARPLPGGAVANVLAAVGLGFPRGDDLVVGIDANRAGPWLADERAALARIRREEPGFWTLVRRSRFLSPAGAAAGAPRVLHAASFSDRLFVVVETAAVAAERRGEEVLAPLLSSLAERATLRRIAAALAVDVWPRRAPALPATQRLLLEEEPRLIQEQVAEAGFVERFHAELEGRWRRREAWFSEVFDSVAIVLLAVFVVSLLRRPARAGAADEEDPST